METKTNGYDCKEYAITTTSEPCKRAGSTWSPAWSKMFRAACKNTCSLYASDYCNQNTCHGKKYNIPEHDVQFTSSMIVDISVINVYRLIFSETQEKRFHTAAQGQICYNIGKMSLKSSYECKEAATAFGKTIKSKIDAQPGWCIFYNNEVYWDVLDGGHLLNPQAQEICSNNVKGCDL